MESPALEPGEFIMVTRACRDAVSKATPAELEIPA